MEKFGQLRIVYVGHRFLHHGKYAGYQMLAQFVENTHLLAPHWAHYMLAPIPDALLFRFPPFHPNWYNREAFDIEGQAAVQMVTGGNTVFHFLYGEHSFRWSGKVNRWAGRRNRVVATYHQLPQFFEQRRSQFSHLRDLDAVILVASNQREFFESVIPSEKVHVIPHGVDTNFFQPPTERTRPDRPLRCLTVGSNYRDFAMHVQVIRNINRSSLRGVEFVAIGEPRCAEYFAGLENVRYLSDISDDELLRWYQTSDVLLLPLQDATACNALLEGMACGLPIVVTDVGGVRDYVDDQSAILVNGADAITESLKNLAEPDKCACLGNSARNRAVQNLDWRIIARQIERVYEQLW
jgi:glycosyltransferase involved in cell wall biosynthesis